MQDPFSWHEDLPYTYPHWAYDVATYIVYQIGETVGIGGFCALYIATIILAMILGIVIYYTMNKLCKNPLISLFISMAIMYLLKDFITARAQLISYILFALTILFIEQFIKTKKKRYAVYLIIIPILLANLHCAVWPFYFVLYLPYIAEYIIVALNDGQIYYLFKVKWNNYKLKKLVKKSNLEDIRKQQEKLAQIELEKNKSKEKGKNRRKNPYKVILKKEPMVKWLVLILIICIFTGFLTPLGTTPYTYLAKTMEGNTTNNISEHQPLTLINNKAMLTVFAVYILLLIFTDTKASLRDFFMLGGMTILSFMSRRQTALFVIICGFIFAKLITELLEKYDKKGTSLVVEFITTILGKILTILIVVLLSIMMFRGKEKDHFVNENSYPIEACNYILENLDVQNIKLFNEYNYGSYLLYRGIPVFIDSRADLYAPEFNGQKNEEGKWEGRDIFSDYINVSNISTYYENKMQEYDITHVIIGKKTKLNMFLSRDGGYEELYSDDNFVVYKRVLE